MNSTKIILVGEGTAEPTTGFQLARNFFPNDNVTFYFGVRRTTEGLEQLDMPDTQVVANFPGRGMRDITCPVSVCSLSSYAVHRAIISGRLKPDAVLVVATPPDDNGIRSIGTANGPIAAALKKAPVIFIEEFSELKVIPGAPTIPDDREIQVISHKPAAFTALSRRPDEADIIIARHIASLIPDGAAIQLGVGGIIEALSQTLVNKKNLISISGAIGSAIRQLDEQGSLNPHHKIYGSSLVGDDELIQWAEIHPHVELLPSDKIHNPRWLAQTPHFYSINIAISADLGGNINAETIAGRHISGKGGSPSFSKGAHLSQNGLSIFALRTDKGNTLVDHIEKPTVHAQFVDCLVTEKGVAILKGKSSEERATLIKSIFPH